MTAPDADLLGICAEIDTLTEAVEASVLAARDEVEKVTQRLKLIMKDDAPAKDESIRAALRSIESLRETRLDMLLIRQVVDEYRQRLRS